MAIALDQSATEPPALVVDGPHNPSAYRPETLALHGGWRADPTNGAVAVPIYQTTSYQFEDAEHARSIFGLERLGFGYTRTSNPTTDVLERRVAGLEGGVGSLAVASGQAASAFAVLALAGAGDNIVSSTDLYGGSWNMFANRLSRFGIETRFVDPSDPENFRRAIDGRTRAFYGETLPNPKLAVFPIAEVAAIGRAVGIPLILDNTAAPLLARPLDHGAAIVVYSATKYLGGHGTSIGGLIVDGGKFDWAAWPDRQPHLNRPDPSYQGAVWVETAARLGVPAYLASVRATMQRDLGAAISPFNSFQILQGIETLPLRIERHSQNAAGVAAWLKQHPLVHWVGHPSLQTGPTRARADRYLRGGYGGLVGFELESAEAGTRFIDALKLFYHVANIGDARSLAIHPASTTHGQLSPADQALAGVTPGYVRLSIGLEHIHDILADLDQALAASRQSRTV